MLQLIFWILEESVCFGIDYVDLFSWQKRQYYKHTCMSYKNHGATKIDQVLQKPLISISSRKVPGTVEK